MPGRPQRPPRPGRTPPATLAERAARGKVFEEVTCGAGGGRGHLPPAGRGRPRSAPHACSPWAGSGGDRLRNMRYGSFPTRTAPRGAGKGREGPDRGPLHHRQPRAPCPALPHGGRGNAANQTPESPQNCSGSVQKRGFYTHTAETLPARSPRMTGAQNTSPGGGGSDAPSDAPSDAHGLGSAPRPHGERGHGRVLSAELAAAPPPARPGTATPLPRTAPGIGTAGGTRRAAVV